MVTVDSKGLGTMHALTQMAVRQLTDNVQRLGLVTAVSGALEEML